MSIGDLAAGAIVVTCMIAICTLIEQFAPIERHSLRSRLPGIAMNIVQKPATLIVAWPLNQLWQSFPAGKLLIIPLWTWIAPLGLAAYALQYLVLAMAEDFFVYWRHRFEHRAFWHVHAVHHAPTELFAANDIGHPLQVVFGLIFVSLPLSLIQLDGPDAPIAVSSFIFLLTYFIHSPIRFHFGPLRWFLVDNRFHRIHHSIEERHFDKNFSVCFSIWDRLFGTAYDPAPDEWPDVGLADTPPPRTIGEYLALPFRRFPAKQSGFEAESCPDPLYEGASQII
jgi:sterol desaturase/sphingolipid hydroxylase (fatty acid hydroxylase superfamily)